MLTNSLGVYVATVGKASPIQALLGLARVPSMYAVPLALVVRGAGIELPYALARPVELMAAAAVPLMILILGMQLGRGGLPTSRGLLAGAAALRLLASPALAWILAPAFGLNAVARQAGILEAAMPTAVLNTVIALEFGVEPAFVTAAVLVSPPEPLDRHPLIALLGRLTAPGGEAETRAARHPRWRRGSSRIRAHWPGGDSQLTFAIALQSA
jgi:predicted permease